MNKGKEQKYITVRLHKQTYDKVVEIAKNKKWNIVTTLEVAIDLFDKNNKEAK